MKKLLLVIFSLAFILFGWVYLGYLSVSSTVLEPTYYDALVDDVQISAPIHRELERRVPEIVFEQMSSSPDVAMMFDENSLRSLSGMISDALLRSFSRQWIDEQIKRAGREVPPWVLGEEQFLEYEVEIADKVEEARDYLIEDLRGLSDEELAQLRIQRNFVNLVVVSIVSGIDYPETVRLAELLEDDEIGPAVEEAVTNVRRTSSLFSVLPYGAFLLFFLLCVLLAGFFRGLRWFGVSLFISGGLFLAAIYLVQALSIVTTRLQSLIGADLVGEQLLSSAVSLTVSTIMLTPAIFTGAGLFLLFIGLLGRGRD